MATRELVSEANAAPAVKAVFDDIRTTRDTDYINNFWRALAHDPDQLERVWQELKTVMAPGALDPLTKEMVYMAVSIANGCEYCIHSHTAAARGKGMSEQQYNELLAVIAMAGKTNHLATSMQVPVDEMFKK